MALLYNGTDETSSVASSAELDLTGDGTIMFWFKTAGSLPANDNRIWVHGNFGIIDGNFLTADNTLTTTIFHSGGSGTVKTSVLSTSTEYHFLYRYDEGTDFKLFENGVLKNTLGSVGTINYFGGAFNLYLAANQAGAKFIPGTFWDVRQYNRILSADEALTIYNARGADRITDGLVLRCLMNEGSVASSPDVSGNNNTMTHTNSPVIANVPFRHY